MKAQNQKKFKKISNGKIKQLSLIMTLLCATNLVYAQTVFEETAVNPDHWVATDALNRTIASHAQAGNKKTNKTVGMFYYLWNGNGQNATFSPKNGFDVEKKIYANPRSPDTIHPDVQDTDPSYWYGFEPELGYYRSDDPWAIRKNLQMLSNAGVDFLYFDGTNGAPYVNRAKLILDEAVKLEQTGVKVPKISWSARADNIPAINQIYKFYIANPQFANLFYKHNGKPLLLLTNNASMNLLPQEIKDYFTIRFSWAFVKDVQTKSDHWQWLDNYPQDAGWSGSPNNIEQISVSKGQHAHSNIGASFTSKSGQPALNNFFETSRTAYGDYFNEQWQRALSISPPIVMVTQWNESIARCFTPSMLPGIKFLGKPLAANECGFVDVFNAEYNRDLQPANNPKFTDNYYYQLIDNVRKYKGMSKQNFASPIQQNFTLGDFSKWRSVGPVYMDYNGDAINRNWPAAMQDMQDYVDTSARNDFVSSRVMSTYNNTFFFAKVRSAISSPSKDWMELWIDADASSKTGFMGYDYVVSGANTSNNTRALLQYNNSTKTWQKIADVPYRITDNNMELSIPSQLIASPFNTVNSNKQVLNTRFYFKWTDNTPLMDASKGLVSLRDYFTKGDSAPDRRFNYEYNRNFNVSSIINNSTASNEGIPFAGTNYEALNGDYDGDGKLDQAIVNKTTGQWYIKSSNTGLLGVDNIAWGWSWTAFGNIFKILEGDFDGDNKTDRAIFNKITGAIFIIGSKVGNNSYIPWGSTWQQLTGQLLSKNHEVLIGDYDGDKLDDIVLFDRDTRIFNTYSSLLKKLGNQLIAANWRFSEVDANTVFIDGDYDGDGLADRAAVNKNTGIWYVISSKFKTRGFEGMPWAFKWLDIGTSNRPFAGDFDGDGKADLGMLNINTGVISIRQTSTGSSSISNGQRINAPLPITESFKIIVHDTNGDGKAELNLFNQATGKYYTTAN